MNPLKSMANALGFGNSDQVADAKKAINQNKGLRIKKL